MAKTLGLTLPLRLGSNGYFETTVDVLTQLRTNIKMLLLTQRGERIMQPLFGCDLPLVLFENNTDDSLAEINGIIRTAIQNWMPFLRVDAVNVDKDRDTNKINISVSYTLLTNNIQDIVSVVLQ